MNRKFESDSDDSRNTLDQEADSDIYINETEENALETYYAEQVEDPIVVGSAQDNKLQEVINSEITNWYAQHPSHVSHEGEVIEKIDITTQEIRDDIRKELNARKTNNSE